MADIPFLNPSVLTQLDLPIPNRIETPLKLEPLNLNRPYEPSKEIQAYRRLYPPQRPSISRYQRLP